MPSPTTAGTVILPPLTGGDAVDFGHEYRAWRDAGFTHGHAVRKAYKRVGVNPVERVAVNAERDRDVRELMSHDTHGTCGGCFESTPRCDCP